MSVKNVVISVIAIILFIGGCIFGFYMLFYQNSNYYTIIDNSKYERIDDNDFNYKYTLPCYDEEGNKKEISFETSRELRSDAYIKIKYMITRGVISWEEVKYEELPNKVKEKFN